MKARMLLAGLLSLALAEPAQGAITATSGAELRAEGPGSPEAPARAALDLIVTLHSEEAPDPQRALHFDLPEQLTLDGTADPKCAAAPCDEAARVGQGNARFASGPFRTYANSTVRAYNGVAPGTLVLVFDGARDFVATGTVAPSGDPAYGSRLSVNVPPEALDDALFEATIEQFKLHLQGHAPGSSYVRLTGCPGGSLPFRAVVDHASGTTATSTATATCSFGELPQPGAGYSPPGEEPSTPGEPGTPSTPTPTPTPSGNTTPTPAPATTTPVTPATAAKPRAKRRAVGRFKVRLRRRGRWLLVTGVKRGSRVRVTGRGGRKLAGRKGGPRRLRMPLRRAIGRNGRFTVRVSAPQRTTRFARYKRVRGTMRLRRVATGLIR